MNLVIIVNVFVASAFQLSRVRTKDFLSENDWIDEEKESNYSSKWTHPLPNLGEHTARNLETRISTSWMFTILLQILGR